MRLYILEQGFVRSLSEPKLEYRPCLLSVNSYSVISQTLASSTTHGRATHVTWR